MRLAMAYAQVHVNACIMTSVFVGKFSSFKV